MNRRRIKARWPLALLLLALVTFLGLYMGLGAIWVAVMMGALCMALDFAAFLAALPELQVDQTLSASECVTGEQLTLTMKIRASKTAGLCAFMAARSERTFFEENQPELPWQMLPSLKSSMQIRSRDVGPQRAGVAELRVFSPLGLFSKNLKLGTAKLEGPRQVLVLPKLHQLMDPVYAERLDFGQHDRQMIRTGDVDSVSGNREYQEGDPLNRINWKLTAARRELYIKDFDGVGKQDCSILYVAPFLPSMRQMALEAALAGGVRLLEFNELTLRLGGEQHTIRRGDGAQLAHTLALCPFMKPNIKEQNEVLTQLTSRRSSCAVLTDGDENTCRLTGALPRGSMVFALGAPAWSRPAIQACRLSCVNLCIERTGEEWKWLHA